LVRGFPVAGPVAETYRLYWAFGALLGQPVPQNGRGHLLGEVTDRGSQYGADPFARGYTSTDEMVFHNDAGDVAGLLCVRDAKAGGDSSVVSSMAIYEAAVETGDERLLRALGRGFRVVVRDDADTSAHMGRTGSRAVTERRLPVFWAWNGRLSGAVNLKSVGVVPQVSGEPMDAEEALAFGFLSETAEREDLKHTFRLTPGDLLLVHNLVVLHKRSKFEDFADLDRKRLLLRLWLALDIGRGLPPEMAGLRRGFNAPPVVNAPPRRAAD